MTTLDLARALAELEQAGELAKAAGRLVTNIVWTR